MLMEKLNIEIDYLDKTSKKKKSLPLFEITLKHILKTLNKQGHYVVSLSIVNNDEMQTLNKTYRGVDKSTDVLTFPYDCNENEAEPFIDLGSIILCLEQCIDEAKEYNFPVDKELAYLFIHGILHSFGYDHHKSQEDEKIMFDLQEKLINTLPYDFYTDVKVLKKNLKSAQSNAYVPYSKFKVGACVVTKDGKYHTGFNIENSAYSVCCCAERVALFRTYAEGYHKEDIVALGCITSSKNIGTPCGVCRQAMSELMNLNCTVYIYNVDMDKELITTVSDLLPYCFTSEDLNSR